MTRQSSLRLVILVIIITVRFVSTSLKLPWTTCCSHWEQRTSFWKRISIMCGWVIDIISHNHDEIRLQINAASYGPIPIRYRRLVFCFSVFSRLWIFVLSVRVDSDFVNFKPKIKHSEDDVITLTSPYCRLITNGPLRACTHPYTICVFSAYHFHFDNQYMITSWERVETMSMEYNSAKYLV